MIPQLTGALATRTGMNSSSEALDGIQEATGGCQNSDFVGFS